MKKRLLLLFMAVLCVGFSQAQRGPNATQLDQIALEEGRWDDQATDETFGAALAGKEPVAAQMFPNPFNSHFTVSLQNGAIEEVRVSDITGNTVLVVRAEGGNTTKITTDALKPGVYFVSLVNEQQVVLTKRLIKHQ